MKKELAAVSILVLLTGCALVNIAYLRGFINGMAEEISASRLWAERGELPAAEERLREVIDRWVGADSYTHIFIRHSEIDSATDAFYDLLSDLSAGDAGSAAGGYEKLLYHLNSIMTMEHLTFGSIF